MFPKWVKIALVQKHYVKEIEIVVLDKSPTVNVIGGAPGMDDLNDQIQSIFD